MNTVRIAAILCIPAMAALAQPSQGAAHKMPSHPAAWLDPDKTEPAGTHYHTFPSKLVGGEVSYLIYLPPTYQTEPVARFPGGLLAPWYERKPTLRGESSSSNSTSQSARKVA